jgi:hypothetical protein
MLAAMQRQQGQQCQRNRGKSAHAMKALMPVQRRRQPASMALLDKLYREESNKCKEAGGAQYNLSDEKDDNKDINKDKDDN